MRPPPRRSKRSGRLRSTVPGTRPQRRRLLTKPHGPMRRPAPRGSAPPFRPPKPEVARILDVSEQSLADVIDSLLNKGVVLNADLILGLANVDLIYVRLSALICAADRLAPAEGIR